MKKFLLATLLLISPSLIAQEDYMNEIVAKACECVSDLDTGEDLNSANLGLCIINEASQFREELLRDHGIDMAHIDMQGEELGRLIALEMLSKCPEQMRRIIENKSDQEEEIQANEILSTEGVIKGISKGDFIVFSIAEADGRTSKFYWLTFIESDSNLQLDFEALVGSKVRLTYSLIELFDYRLGEYRNYNIINSFETLN